MHHYLFYVGHVLWEERSVYKDYWNSFNCFPLVSFLTVFQECLMRFLYFGLLKFSVMNFFVLGSAG